MKEQEKMKREYSEQSLFGAYMLGLWVSWLACLIIIQIGGYVIGMFLIIPVMFLIFMLVKLLIYYHINKNEIKKNR